LTTTNWPALQFVGPTFENGLQANTFYSASMTRQMHVFAAGYLLSVTIGRNARKQQAAHAVEHSNSGKKVSIRFDSIPQSDKFAASTLIFK